MRKFFAAGLTALTLTTPIAAHATTHAGQTIFLDAPQGYGFACTLAYTTTINTGETWGVTAAHCFDDPNIERVTNNEGEVLADQAELSRMKIYSDGPAMNPLVSPTNDVAMFPIKPGIQHDQGSIHSLPETNSFLAQFAHTPIAQALNNPLALGEPYTINPNMTGQFVCKEGSATGRTCGIITGVNAQSGEVYALIPALEGDSGGPLHLLGPDGKRHVIATLSGGTPLLYNGFDSPLTYPQP